MKFDARKHARRIYNDSSSSSGIISTGSVFGRRASGREPGGGGVKRERESTVSAGGADEAGTTRAVAVDTGRSLIAGTSADGSFRVFVERRPDQPLPAVLGALKDELIGLGWEPSEEKHYAAAVSIDMARGPKQARQLRSTWVIELGADVLVCEAIANAISPSAAVTSTAEGAALPSPSAIHDLQSARLGRPLRTLCESLRVTK